MANTKVASGLKGLVKVDGTRRQAQFIIRQSQTILRRSDGISAWIFHQVLSRGFIAVYRHRLCRSGRQHL